MQMCWGDLQWVLLSLHSPRVWADVRGQQAEALQLHFHLDSLCSAVVCGPGQRPLKTQCAIVWGPAESGTLRMNWEGRHTGGRQEG